MGLIITGCMLANKIVLLLKATSLPTNKEYVGDNMAFEYPSLKWLISQFGLHATPPPLSSSIGPAYLDK